uniref:Uncharacterized protein n=1 Tax=Pipistrellus kuhlii TaxID=59472 RepID=A0A7J7VBF5_PIPKU|nr:hypothetical protein mPipKuh1_008494 [Pipistrellus kuhlii]
MAKIDKNMQSETGPWDCHICDSLAPSPTISNWLQIPGDSTSRCSHICSCFPVLVCSCFSASSLAHLQPTCIHYQMGPHLMLKTFGGSHSSQTVSEFPTSYFCSFGLSPLKRSSFVLILESLRHSKHLRDVC